MRWHHLTTAILAGFATTSAAAPSARGVPTVTLDQGTFTGAADGVANKFLGIPFAHPPTGDLRFRLPVANDPYTGTHDATAFGLSCSQQGVSLSIPSSIVSNITDFLVNTVIDVVVPSGEDCLTLNVWTPAGVAAGTKLPVVVWIFGGGFEIGSTSTYDGGVIVSRSVDLGKPVVYVSMNYRISALGFLASQEVKDAGVGNLGLQDRASTSRPQRPPKWTSSSRCTRKTRPRARRSTRASSMCCHHSSSGSQPCKATSSSKLPDGSSCPIRPASRTHGLSVRISYRTLPISWSTPSSTSRCLLGKTVGCCQICFGPSTDILSRQSLDLAWTPRADGVFLADDPQVLVQQGSVANIPFVTGNCDDEGTLFSISLLNITTEAELRSYLAKFYLPTATSAEVDQLLKLYPQDPTQGSPFDTGLHNVLSPQFKRLAALQGDLVFQAPRRLLLSHTSSKQNTWSFLNKRLKLTPGLGSAHSTDLLNVYTGGDMAVYLINFANHFDPNGSGLLSWPKYTTSSPRLLTFLDGPIPLEISQDTYRTDAMNFLTQLSLEAPL
ncbi:hypothetical protein PHLGIDRAFT_74623 [Phlebiopsis gigantea 11061_1 CR5-6]|uniref:Carboxylesterase type B domain-containing protein n=1 Tax=Phlebiopsis gigantea (strain 11061_1 CR5-6) TaxID=745531 RepID=A0A0C3NJT6_PHLG1|nr:hypothetical protein PHLGIDRAFT_74623 [Phlebiopsis gigantea 11061_1 CR5-6]